MKNLNKTVVGAVVFAILCLASSGADARCARWGETGYHFYHSCWGPSFLYPHHRRCHHGYCHYY